MKLHKVKKGAQVLVRRVDEDIYVPYTTKEDKTYFSELMRDLEEDSYLFTRVIVSGEGERSLVSECYVVILSKDGKYEMIVPRKMVEFYCNIED